MTVSIWSFVAKMFTYTESWAPSSASASSKICAIASADSGHCGACLRRIVLPLTTFGPANRATW